MVCEIKFFLSSPGDVSQERQLVHHVIQEVLAREYPRPHYEMYIVDWAKSAPIDSGKHPQAAIQARLGRPRDCDVVIVIFGKRMGTPLPFPDYQKQDGSRYESGTEWEFEDALAGLEETNGGRPYLYVFQKKLTGVINLKSRDAIEQCRQLVRLDNFFQRRFMDNDALKRVAFSFETPEDFEQTITEELRKCIRDIIANNPENNAMSILEIMEKGYDFAADIQQQSKLTPQKFEAAREYLLGRKYLSIIVGKWLITGSGKKALNAYLDKINR